MGMGGMPERKKIKKITSEEVARKAGVSRSTVSRVVNGYSNVPEATREKVMSVIQSMGYYPSFPGQVLAGKGTRTIGFVVVAPGGVAGDIQFSSYCAYVVDRAAELGYMVLSIFVKDIHDPGDSERIKRIFMEDRVDGGVFIGVDNDEPLIEELIAAGKIVGLFDHFHPDRSEPNRISVNYETNTGEKMIDYLYSLGHRKIGIIQGNMDRYSLVCRHESFIRGMTKHHLELRRDWMYAHYENMNGGYPEAIQMVENSRELPTAIAVYNDVAAFGVYQALEEKGLRIPEDISVIGNDGHEKGNIVVPHLTTFAFPYQQIFASLVERVIARIEGQEDVPTTEFFSSTLVERDSCRRV